jgi:NAD(P)-dependent dehydrogenase (short-subunit alcohol dehydrogenase family)
MTKNTLCIEQRAMDLRLGGQVAVITGGASGIGLATAKLFAAEGVNVAIWDLDPGAEVIAREIQDLYGGQAIGLQVDVSQESSVSEALAKTLESFETIHHVVHSAAIGSSKFGFPFTNLSPEDWKRTLDVNILGMVRIATALSPVLIRSRTGTCVFVGSVAGQIGSQTDPPYSASKAATINFAQCMAKDLAVHNVRVNTVCPGMVPTKLNRSIWQAWYDRVEIAQRLDYDVWAERKIKQLIPLGQWQTPEDIAAMIVFLSSPLAGQVTGQTINVDGGYVMHW